MLTQAPSEVMLQLPGLESDCVSQVMDPASAPKRALQKRKGGTKLVAFFGEQAACTLLTYHCR